MPSEPGSYHWIKSDITGDPDRWEIAFIDSNDHVWIFGVSGWFPLTDIQEIGPKLERPSREEQP